MTTTPAELDALLDQAGRPAIVVHGGAGTSVNDDPAPYLAGAARAAEAGLRVLLAGGSALDAAQAATVALEDDPTFNAGTGACLTSAGDCELDASCMDGATLKAGAVACVKTVKNPILLARRVCDDSPHVLIAGPGADAFARECGIPEYPNTLFITPKALARFQELRTKAEREGADSVRRGIGTVGAVAVDAHGHVAACTSTGGTPYKRPGRVGDTPIIGAGTYANDAEGAASSTGLGEAIVKVQMARAACFRIKEFGLSPLQAARFAVGLLRERAEGDGGIIVAGADGRLGWALNTPRMTRAFVRAGMSGPLTSV
jgi:beta-aspartyl-peptidase (threonine type)